ncbi:type IV pilus modification PilV family protein [Ruminococcus albus]|uniref:Prepilin-type N-terminal cleavage/methylation domain-containing protein n=1 Tax=Ruminococcus albus TaxID=1264 RepID=A0A1I1JAM1_RUMAL|nr:prepilin-type N-terminal cleavage/methylation domain-containing protein [Ruminococcus albus]SFC45637.1 prepilin-type N-terminal cleavage/methylation domain-containing protein [Ruminococcus albus]
MKFNKKGMTLVECIIAMAVFAVATTGFTMVATACMKAQAKTGARMTKTNTQSTNLEHFSTYAKVLDPGYTNVSPMYAGTNQFQMTFNFEKAGITVQNKNVYGYYAKLEDTDKDSVFDLSFFTPANQVQLSDGEYWVTLYNYDSEQHTWDITCNSDFAFFDNEKNTTQQQTLPRHIWAPNGGYYKFGIKQKTPGVGDITSCLTIHSYEDNADYPPVGISDKMPNGALGTEGGDNMVYIYYYNGAFQTPEQFDADHPDPNA